MFIKIKAFGPCDVLFLRVWLNSLKFIYYYSEIYFYKIIFLGVNNINLTTLIFADSARWG